MSRHCIKQLGAQANAYAKIRQAGAYVNRETLAPVMRICVAVCTMLVGLFTTCTVQAQEGYDGGLERTQIARLSDFTSADTTQPLQLHYEKDNNREQSKKIKNIITFSFKEETPLFIPGNFSATVRVRIAYGHAGYTEYTVDTALTISYDSAAHHQHHPRADFVFNRAEYVQASILHIEAPVINGFNVRTLLCLQNEMEVTRYYQLAQNLSPVAVSAAADATAPQVPDELTVNWQWPDTTGNNYTQLEWSWLEDEYAGNYTDGSGHLNTTALFRNNATRVDLPAGVVSYRIPLFYDGTGKLYYRLRAISVTPSGTQLAGAWSDAYTYTFGGHNNDLNWQVTTSYAEDGKRKTVIQYYDGSLRSRQTVTKDNTTNTTIAAETFYDGQGRPAVQVLPAPGINQVVAYTANLNRFNGQPLNSDPAAYFDLQPVSSTSAATPALNDSSGAAQYYSSLNPAISDSIHQNIPQANGFAYAVTRYTPDATGRIKTQSGVGEALKMGSGHETNYYYGTPAQEELDGLFGTEVGNYTHYFENMVQDANGQMSVSYVDMHGRTVATALAGDAPPSLDTLDIRNGNDYPNQAGTRITRNLLSEASNVVKDDTALESVNSLLAPASTTFRFTYHFPPRTLSLPSCTGGTLQYPCLYNLSITITDESGDQAPVQLQYSSQADSVQVSDSITLPAGSYSVRKTLSIDPATLQQNEAAYLQPGNGLCQSQQEIIDSVTAVMEAQSGCGQPPVAVTCQSCLDSLGSYSTFLNQYATSLGTTAGALTPDQQSSIRTEYINDSLHCQQLTPGSQHTLDNIQQMMLADLMPFGGQYAQDPAALPSGDDGSSLFKGSMYYKYNIFAATNGSIEHTGLFYRRPLSGSRSNWSVYNNAQGIADPTVPQAVLDTLSAAGFAARFNPAWATALLPYHPEYSKLQYARQYLQSSYDWQDRLNNVTTYSQASDSGYTGDITQHDPFFTLSGTISLKTLMQGYIGHPWQQGLTMWQVAYASAICSMQSNDPAAVGQCAAGVPVMPSYSGLTTAQQDQLWNTFKNLYLQARNEQVNQYLATQVASDAATLAAQHYILHFPLSNSQQAQQYQWTWYPAGGAGSTTIPVNPSDTAAAMEQGRCLSYVPNWQQQLLQCSALAALDSTTRTGILNEITSRMTAVCQQGTDNANPYGSSDLAAGATPANAYGDSSFEQIVNDVYAAHHLPKDVYCNPYVIQFPRPHGRNPLLVPQQTVAVDTCNCKQFAQVLLNAYTHGVDTTSLAAINHYLDTTYGDTLTAGLYAGLKHCSALNGKAAQVDTITTTAYATTSVIFNQQTTWNGSSAVISSYSTDTTTDKIVGAYPNYSSGTYFPIPASGTFFRFDTLPVLPAGARLLSATLNLYAYPAGFHPPAQPDAHGTFSTVGHLIRTPQVVLEAPDFSWNKTTTAVTFESHLPNLTLTDQYTNPAFPVLNTTSVTSNDDLSVDLSTTFTGWNADPSTNKGLLLSVEEPVVDSLTYATFCSNKYAYPPKRPTLVVTYIDSQANVSLGYYLLAQPQPLPPFLQCGYDLNSSANCYSCTQLAALTTQFKAAFTGTPAATAPVFSGSDLDTSTLQYNTLYARYLNYKTGLQYTWLQYSQAISAHSCNLASGAGAAGSVICATTTALTDTTGLNLAPASPCDQTDAFATAAAQNIYRLRQQQALAAFDSAYRARALSVPEQFTVTYTPKEYHYTLYYYDQAGNLVKTIPPKGVHPDFSNTFTDAVEAAKQTGTTLVPAHSYTTNYRYNTLNQVIAQHTPDGGTSHFWYDRLGRLVVSQNAKQASSSYVAPDGATGPAYSYTLYDALGRLTEVGEIPQSTPMTQTISQDSGALSSWVTTPASREQITYTVYDTSYTPIKDVYLTQQNLRNRVSYTMTKNKETDNYPYTATYYSYDVHGNVDTLLQDYKGIASMDSTQQRFKRIAYTYDVISSKVNTVSYQPGQPDAFYHAYQYDAENRLTEVLTSRDSIVWERQAAYSYYKHGPLARTVLGQQQVQGIDYSYTLQGWLNGVNTVYGGNPLADGLGCTPGTGLDSLHINYRTKNSPPVYAARHLIEFTNGFTTGAGDSLQSNLDSNLPACVSPAAATCAHCETFPVAQDAYTFSLHYYPGDYTALNGSSPTDIFGALGSSAAPLYNGNIAAMAVNLAPASAGAGNEGNGSLAQASACASCAGALVYNYHYDQLNRLVAMDAYTGLNTTTGAFNPVQVDDYKERISYDPNGNITSYLRNGTGSTLNLNNYTYNYTANTNQVASITNSVNSNTGTYSYDAIGNVIKDDKQNVTANTWSVYDKLLSIQKSDGTVINYSYDAMGNRISKQIGDTTECYVRDASGNIMAVYKQKGSSAALQQTEVDIYGSSRIGYLDTLTVKPDSIALDGDFGTAVIEEQTRGEVNFTLTDQVGSVMAVVSDRKVAVDSNSDGWIDYYLPSLKNAQFYSAFGAISNSYSSTDLAQASACAQSPYAFDGQRRSREISPTAQTAEYWEYNGDVGRRWNMDPKPAIGVSQYSTFYDNPIWHTDIFGDTTVYFNSTGTVLLKTTEKDKALGNVITVIPDANLKKFDSIVATLTVGKTDLSATASVKALRSSGISYDIARVFKFVDNNAKNYNTSGNWTPTDGKGPLINEAAAAVELVNGVYFVNPNKTDNTPGSPFSSLKQSSPVSLHTHDNEGRSFRQNYGDHLTGHVLTGAASAGEDIPHAFNQPGTGYLEMAAGKKSIYFFNQSGVIIQVNRDFFASKYFKK